MGAFAPIFDANRKLVGATGVDMSLEDFELQRSGLRHVASLSALGVLYLAYLAGHGMAGYHRRLKSSVESLMKANEAAMAAERVKNDFLGAMSHELRTPLNAVLGMTEMLSQTKLDDSQREMVGTVQRSGESLLATLTSILEFTQLDPDRSQVKAEETNLATLLQELHKHHEPTLREKGLQVVQKKADDCPGFFTAQTVFLRQVLSQLLSNAIKFTDISYSCPTFNSGFLPSKRLRLRSIFFKKNTVLAVYLISEHRIVRLGKHGCSVLAGQG